MLCTCGGVFEKAFLLFLFVFCASCLFNPGFLSWHDQQRVAQLLLLTVMAPMVYHAADKGLPKYVFFAFIFIALLGLLSSAYSLCPEWALKEWGRCLALFLGVIVVRGLVRRSYVRFAIFGCMVFVGSVQVFQFLIGYISAFLSGMRVLHADVLISGFSNPRFFGQFQVLLFPVLAFLIVKFTLDRHFKVATLIMGVLVFHWGLSYALGGRGLWVSVFFSHIFILFFFRKYWPFLLVQFLGALTGFGVFIVLFISIPSWFDIIPWVHDGLRSGLSSRQLIWNLSFEMAVDNAWLGVGPMHFSAIYNPVAAHPHQVLLQWFSEWGAPSAVLAVFLVARGVLAGIFVLCDKNNDYEDVGLWVALVGGVVLAQVDGVFVMPYTEMWLALLAGISFFRWSEPSATTVGQRLALGFTSIPVVLILGVVLLKEVPVLHATEAAYLKENSIGLAPRFWEQGWIPMPQRE